MEPHITDLGTPHRWLVVPYDGPELAVIEIGFAGRWTPAYLDHVDGQRVAMIRHEGRLPAGPLRVRADGAIKSVWNISAQPRRGGVQ